MALLLAGRGQRVQLSPSMEPPRKYQFNGRTTFRRGARSKILREFISEDEELKMEAERTKYAERTAEEGNYESRRWRNFVLRCPKTSHKEVCVGCTAADCETQRWFGDT